MTTTLVCVPSSSGISVTFIQSAVLRSEVRCRVYAFESEGQETMIVLLEESEKSAF